VAAGIKVVKRIEDKVELGEPLGIKLAVLYVRMVGF
jgi:hypothetical protein